VQPVHEGGPWAAGSACQPEYTEADAIGQASLSRGTGARGRSRSARGVLEELGTRRLSPMATRTAPSTRRWHAQRQALPLPWRRGAPGLGERRPPRSRPPDRLPAPNGTFPGGNRRRASRRGCQSTSSGYWKRAVGEAAYPGSASCADTGDRTAGGGWGGSRERNGRTPTVTLGARQGLPAREHCRARKTSLRGRAALPVHHRVVAAHLARKGRPPGDSAVRSGRPNQCQVEQHREVEDGLVVEAGEAPGKGTPSMGIRSPRSARPARSGGGGP
jgi:hypothetical protein